MIHALIHVLQLEKLEELARAATPGPWRCEIGGDPTPWPGWPQQPPKGHVITSSPKGEPWNQGTIAIASPLYTSKQDLTFMAACSPDVVLALIEEAKHSQQRADPCGTDLRVALQENAVLRERLAKYEEAQELPVHALDKLDQVVLDLHDAWTWGCRSATDEDQIVGMVDGWLLYTDGPSGERVEADGMEEGIATSLVEVLNAVPALLAASRGSAVARAELVEANKQRASAIRARQLKLDGALEEIKRLQLEVERLRALLPGEIGGGL